MAKRSSNNANLSPLTPHILATTGQASDIRRKINTLTKISTSLLKLLDDTATPDDIKNRFVSVNNILGEFKGAMWLRQQQKQQIQQAQTKIGARLMPKTPTKTPPVEPISKPPAVVPGPEEHQRLRSIVFIGLPENNSSTPSARQQADHITAIKLLDELGVEASPSDCFRLGRFPNQAGTGPRLLPISLPSPKFKWAALGQWKKKRTTIRAMPGFDRLLIRPSLSAAQRSEEKRRATPSQSPRPSNKPEEAATSSAQPEEEQDVPMIPAQGSTAEFSEETKLFQEQTKRLSQQVAALAELYKK